MTGTALLIVAGTIVCAAFNPFKAGKRAAMAESMNNAKQVKLALDSFAMDNDGVYPSKDTAEFYETSKNGKWSNEPFQQLFASGNTNSERIFWVKRAKVCNAEAPDDVTTVRGRLELREILKSGDCGWAYVGEQVNTDHPERPILIDAYKPGTKEFDRKLWNDKVIVLLIDGSVRAMPLDAKGKVLAEGKDILSAASAAWVKSGTDPAKLLLQPEPAKAAKGKAAPPEKNAAGAAEDRPEKE